MSSSTGLQDFIGRERELSVLRTSLDNALSGGARTVLLAGEAGIGKTRIVQAFSGAAAALGVLALWGRCHEESGAPAYWPWVQILRRFAVCRDDHALGAALGTGASLIAQIWPDLRDRFPGLPEPEPLADAVQARFRLFDAMGEFWKRAAAGQPLLLIFEDLHWADAASLRLLEFVAGEAAGSRLLFVGTMRDEELSGAHSLAPVLDRLQRTSIVHRLPLTGLTNAETGRLIETTTGSRPSETVVAFIQAKSGGNPLFAGEIARHLVQEGTLSADGPCAALDPERSAWRVPQGIRACIRSRLDRLSTTTRDVLQAATVIGIRFSFGQARRLNEDHSDEQLLTVLDEAVAQHIIIESQGEPRWYAFAHVLIRDALYEEVGSVRRAQLHQRIGTALEEDHRHNLAPYLSLLAHHFNAASPLGATAKAIGYAMQAAEQARVQLAYEEAARYLTMALNTLERTQPLDVALRCKLAIALGSVQMKCGEAMRALEVLTEAADEAGRLGAGTELAQAAIEFEEVAWRLGLSSARTAGLLEESLEHLEEGDAATRVRLECALVRALMFAGMSERADKMHRDAVLLARRLGDAEHLEEALRSGFWLPWNPLSLGALLATAQEAMALAESIGNRERVLDTAVFRLHLLLAMGDFEGFSGDLERFAEIAGELRQPFHQYHATLMRAAQALLIGRFTDAETLARVALGQGKRLPGLDAQGAFGVQMFTLAQLRGELRQLASGVRRFIETTRASSTWRPALALMLAEVGEHQAARAELDELAPGQFRAIARDSLWVACLAYLSQACALLGDRTHADSLYTLLLPWEGRNVIAGSLIVCYGPADHFLGLLCACLQRWDDAQRHFEAAMEMNRRQQSKPWLAHTQCQYAAMLLERQQAGDKQRADTLLEDARRLALELGMTTLEEHVSQLQHRLRSGTTRPAYPGGLSRREAQVLRLIAAGKSNQQIANEIFRSPNTVANHVRSILAKLGAVNRTQAASLAAQHGLLQLSDSSRRR